MLSAKAVLLLAAASAALGVVAASPTVTTSGPLLVIIAGAERHRRRARVVRLADAELLPPVVDRFIQHLRSGRSLAQSCAMIGDRIGDEDGPGSAPDGQRLLAPLTDSLQRRRTLTEAADALLESGEPSVRLLAVTLRVLSTNGGPAVPALQRLRHTLIGVVHTHEQAAAQSSQALASAGTMMAAPVVAAVGVAALHRPAARLYLFEPVGAVCVFVAIAVSAVGWWWIQRTVGGLERRLR